VKMAWLTLMTPRIQIQTIPTLMCRTSAPPTAEPPGDLITSTCNNEKTIGSWLASQEGRFDLPEYTPINGCKI